MSKYTEELSNIVNSITYGSNKSLSERIDESLTTIFSFDYPIWNVDYRKILERKIIMHYYSFEIGSETPQLFQLRLAERLNLIMPYYNDLYKSTVIEYDMTKNININNVDVENQTNNVNDVRSETISDTINGTSNKNNSGVNTTANTGTTKEEIVGETIRYDVPQVKASGKDYASNLDDITNTNTNTINTEISLTVNENEANTNSNTRNATNTISNNITNSNSINRSNNQSGNNVSISELILKYRDTLINIDNMIIDDLKDLFMLVY